MRKCKVDHCDRKRRAAGLCVAHYRRQRIHGSSHIVNLRAVHARCNLSRNNRWLSGQPQLPIG